MASQQQQQKSETYKRNIQALVLRGLNMKYINFIALTLAGLFYSSELLSSDAGLTITGVQTEILFKAKTA